MILLRQLKALLNHVAVLLHRVGRQHQIIVVAVPSALDGLEVIALGG